MCFTIVGINWIKCKNYEENEEEIFNPFIRNTIKKKELDLLHDEESFENEKNKKEKSNLIKIRKKSKERVIKNKILKNVSKKCSLPEPILIKKMIKKENINNKINILSKSEIKKRRAKSNNKPKAASYKKRNEKK